ncbi:MAG: hypothetical protein WCS52_02315 [bacterium]
MPISRTDASIIRGPAILTYNSVTLYAKDDIKVKTRFDLFDIPASGYGAIDQRIKQVVTEITFTPHGEVSSGILGVLFPHASAVTGASAMPATDKDLVIHPYNGKEKCTYKNAFVSKMPDLSLGATKTAFGQVTFTAIGTNNAAWSVAEHFSAVADAAFSDTGLAATGVKTVPYTAALGALGTPWNGIKTKSGWTISFDVGVDPQEEDSVGIFDHIYNGQAKISAKCNPIGITVTNLHALMATFQGAGAARGASATANKANLVISGGSGAPTVTLNGMILTDAPHRYGTGDRVEELDLMSVRGVTLGVLDALFTIGMVA